MLSHSFPGCGAMASSSHCLICHTMLTFLLDCHLLVDKDSVCHYYPSLSGTLSNTFCVNLIEVYLLAPFLCREEKYGPIRLFTCSETAQAPPTELLYHAVIRVLSGTSPHSSRLESPGLIALSLFPRDSVHVSRRVC